MVVIVLTKPAEKIVPGVRIGVVIRPSVTGPSVVKLKLCTKSPRSLCRSSVVVQQLLTLCRQCMMPGFYKWSKDPRNCEALTLVLLNRFNCIFHHSNEKKFF